MAQVKVYLYDYFDGLLKRERRSTDYATSDAIAALRGTVIAESVKQVDESLVDDEGRIRAADIPPPDVPTERPRWNNPDDVGVGPG